MKTSLGGILIVGISILIGVSIGLFSSTFATPQQEIQSPAAITESVKEDSVLTAFLLDTNQEIEFAKSSDKISSFWKVWQEMFIPVPMLSPEKFGKELTRSDRPFADDYDALMTVKAAYGTKGVYILFDVIDDELGGTYSEYAWANDAVDFCIDRFSSAELKSDPEKHFFLSPYNQTKTMTQFQHQFYKSIPEDSLSVNTCRPNLTGNLVEIFGRGHADDSLFFYKRYSMKAARDSFGIIVKTHKLNAMRGVQEWFIPWKVIGLDKKPVIGTKRAMYFDYNDLDSRDTIGRAGNKKFGARKITWRKDGDSYCVGPRIWGDLEFSRKILPSKIPLTNVKRFIAAATEYQGSFSGTPLSDSAPEALKRKPKNPEKYLYGAFHINGHVVCFATTKGSTPEPITTIDVNLKKPAVPPQIPVKDRVIIIDANFDYDLSNDSIRHYKAAPGILYAGKLMPSDSSEGYLYDSLVIDNDTACFEIQDGRLYSSYLMYKRRDGLKGEVEIDGLKYGIKLWDTWMQGYTPYCHFSIDANRDGVIDSAIGSNERYENLTSPVVIKDLNFRIINFSANGRTIEANDFKQDGYMRYNVSVGSKAPDFNAQLSTDRTMNLYSELAKTNYTILYFYTEGCPGCANINNAEKSPLEATKYLLNKMVGSSQIIGIKIDEQSTNFARGFPSVIDISQAGQTVSDKFHINSIPYAIIMDRKGTIIFNNNIGDLSSDVYNLWKGLKRKDADAAVKQGYKFLGQK